MARKTGSLDPVREKDEQLGRIEREDISPDVVEEVFPGAEVISRRPIAPPLPPTFDDQTDPSGEQRLALEMDAQSEAMARAQAEREQPTLRLPEEGVADVTLPQQEVTNIPDSPIQVGDGDTFIQSILNEELMAEGLDPGQINPQFFQEGVSNISEGVQAAVDTEGQQVAPLETREKQVRERASEVAKTLRRYYLTRLDNEFNELEIQTTDQIGLNQIQRLANLIAAPLTKLEINREGEVEGKSVLQEIKELTNTPDAAMIRDKIITSYFRIAVGALESRGRDKDVPDVTADLTEEPLGFTDFVLDDEPASPGLFDTNVGIEQGIFTEILGRMLFEDLNPAVFGSDLSVVSTPTADINNIRLLGQLAGIVLEEAGMLNLKGERLADPTKPEGRLNPKINVAFVAGRDAISSIMATQALIKKEFKDKAESSSVPGGRGGKGSGINQPQDIRRTSKPTEVIERSQEIISQVGHVINPVTATLFKALNSVPNEFNVQDDPEALRLIQTMRKLTNNGFDDDGNVKKSPEGIGTKKANFKYINDVLSRISNDAPVRYVRSFSDGLYGRVYVTSNDVNHQRDTVFRQLWSPAVKPRIRPSLFKKTKNREDSLISPEIVKGFMTEITTNYKGDFSPLTEEIAFLYSSFALLNPNHNKRINVNLELLTNGKIKEAAQIGNAFKALFEGIDNGLVGDAAREAINSKGNLNLFTELKQKNPAAFKTVLDILSNKKNNINKKNWGAVVQTYMDIASYVDGEPFNASAIIPIDARSAGRAVMALDLGGAANAIIARELFEAVGLFMEDYIDSNVVLPNGNPREKFLKNFQTAILKYFNDESTTGETSTSAIYDVILDLYKEKGTEFADDLFKAILMTSDYGKGISTHMDSATKILRENPIIFNVLKKELDDIRESNTQDLEVIRAFADILGYGLQNALVSIQNKIPKNMASFAVAVGEVFQPKNVFGKTMPIAAEKVFQGAVEGTLSSTYNSETRPVFSSFSKIEPTQRTQKRFDEITGLEKSEEEAKKISYIGDTGSAIINAILAAQAQAGEAFLVHGANVDVNGNREVPHYYVQIFDSILSDPVNIIRFMHSVNNVQVKRLAKFRQSAENVKEFERIFKIANEKVQTLPENIIIDKDNAFFGLIEAIDDINDLINQKDTGPKSKHHADLNTKNKQFIKTAKSLGFKSYEERNGKPLKLTKEQLNRLLGLYYKHLLPSKSLSDYKILSEKRGDLVQGSIDSDNPSEFFGIGS